MSGIETLNDLIGALAALDPTLPLDNVTDVRDRPERLIVRPGPAPCDRFEYPLARVVSIHMEPIGAMP